MAKWFIKVFTGGVAARAYEYYTDSDDQKNDILNREKAKKEVIEIQVNKVRKYKKKLK